MSDLVDVTNPVRPSFYVAYTGPEALTKAIERVRNGTAIFWEIPLPAPHHGVDQGLFAPGSGYTPPGATLYGPPGDEVGLGLPGIPQYTPGTAGYPHVTTGSVSVEFSASNRIRFHLN